MELVRRLRKWLGPFGVFEFRLPDWSLRKRRLAKSATIEDLRQIARRRLPRGVFDYIDGGAEDEVTMAANASAYRRLTFSPRVLRDVSEVDISSTLLGRELSYPLVLAPTGFTRIADPAGELAVARAARRAGLPYALSTLSTRSIEEVAEAGSDRLWFQVYTWKDRDLVTDLLKRAAAVGYEAICLTVDVAVPGRRERDVRRGFTLPPKVGPSTILDGILHPGWAWQFMTSEPILFANVVGMSVGDGSDAISLAEYVGKRTQSSLPTMVSRRSRSRTMGAASSTPPQPHSICCPRSSTLSADGQRSSAMAGCDVAVTSSRPSPSAPTL